VEQTIRDWYAKLLCGAQSAEAWAKQPQNADLLRFGTQISEGGVLPGQSAGSKLAGSLAEEAIEAATQAAARKVGGAAMNEGLQQVAPQQPQQQPAVPTVRDRINDAWSLWSTVANAPDSYAAGW
jgi:hypothetical protein